MLILIWSKFIAVLHQLQWFNLTGETIVTSRDFAGNGVNTTGKLPESLWDEFVITDIFHDASGYRRCPVWVTSGMGQAI